MSETQPDPKGSQTSAGEEGNTSEQEDPTLTESQAKARENKARSDALAEVGRYRKAAEDATRITRDVTKRLQEREEAELKREEEAVKDDPAKLTALGMKREALKSKREAEELLQKAEEKEAEIQNKEKAILRHHADRLAERYSIDADTLLKFGGATEDSLADLAKKFGEKTPTGESKDRETEAPDSGRTKGGAPSGRKPTLAEVQAATPEEFEAKTKSGEWKVF